MITAGDIILFEDTVEGEGTLGWVIYTDGVLIEVLTLGSSALSSIFGSYILETHKIVNLNSIKIVLHTDKLEDALSILDGQEDIEHDE